jgi:hypothetical protein
MRTNGEVDHLEHVGDGEGILPVGEPRLSAEQETEDLLLKWRSFCHAVVSHHEPA